jgi:hypothetical protein
MTERYRLSTHPLNKVNATLLALFQQQRSVAAIESGQ